MLMMITKHHATISRFFFYPRRHDAIRCNYLPAAWMGGFPLVPPLVASWLLCPSGPFRTTRLFLRPFSITILLHHFTRSEEADDTDLRPPFASYGSGSLLYVLHRRLELIMDWKVALRGERDRIRDQPLERASVLVQIQGMLVFD